MINKFTWHVAAAALGLALASSSSAFADKMIEDSNSGLPTMYYNGTLCDLQRNGLPISQGAKDYLKQHPCTNESFQHTRGRH